MPHFSPIYYLAVIFIAVLVTNSEAKRGCALYGHSCYGGHGKRSDAPRVDLSLEPPQDKGFSNINKEIFYPMNNELHGVNQMDLNNNDNRWKSKSEMPYIPLVNLLQRMIEESRKNSDEVQQTPETDTIFKNTYI